MPEARDGGEYDPDRVFTVPYLVASDMRLMKDLATFRKRQQIDQATVTVRMGGDPSGVSKIEAGYRDLLQSTIQCYALAIGAVIEYQVKTFDEVDQGSPQPSSSQ